ncbi:MAG: hypothetical protein H6R40_169 [Gemmatimonadetes bacterium]|nr:hypothetical protein [Gemmatimonadota bacterium]
MGMPRGGRSFRLALLVLAGVVTACGPESFTEPPAPPHEPSPDPSPYYSDTELQAFNTLVFSGNGVARLRKWDGPIRIRLAGSPTRADSDAVIEVARQLSAAFRTIPVSVADGNANVEVMFMPDSAFRNLAGGRCAPPGGVWGMSCPTWDATWRYTGVSTYITSLRNDQARRYLAFHELMHMAGFYDHLSALASVLTRPEILSYQTFQPLDLTLFEMMGRPELKPGMLGDEAMGILRDLPRLGQ